MYLIGDFLVITKYIMGRIMNPWIHRPSSTVMKYMPSCPMMTSKLSISSILDETKNNTPTGDVQITQFVINIIPALKQLKKESKGSAVAPIFPMAMPNTVEKTTKPSMFVPETYSCVIFHSYISTERNVEMKCCEGPSKAATLLILSCYYHFQSLVE